MPDPTTDVQLSDGTTLRLQGQLTPDQAAAKVKAYRASQAPKAPLFTRDINAPGPSGPQGATPMERLGNLVPQGAIPGLAWGQRNLVDPFDRMAQSGAKFMGDLGASTVEGFDILTHPGRIPDPRQVQGPMPPAANQAQQAAQDFPKATGVARGAGQTIGGAAADPRYWPLMAESAAMPTVKRLLSAGFSAQMLHHAYSNIPEIHDAINKGDQEKAAQLITETAASGAFGTLAAYHATMGGEVPTTGPREHPETVRTNGVDKAVSKPEPSPITPSPIPSPEATEQFNRIEPQAKPPVEASLIQGWMNPPPVEPKVGRGMAKDFDPTSTATDPGERVRQIPFDAPKDVWKAAVEGRDVGEKVRDAAPAMPRGERRQAPLTYEQTMNRALADKLPEDFTPEQLQKAKEEYQIANPDLRAGGDRRVDEMGRLKTRLAELETPKAKGEVAQPESADYWKHPLTLTPTGDTFVDRAVYSDKQMAERSMYQMERAKSQGNTEDFLSHARTWAQYSDKDTVERSVKGMTNRADFLGQRINKSMQLAKALLSAKVSFRDTKDATKITREQFRDVAGKSLPPVPKDFLSQLPAELGYQIEGLKGQQKQETVSRYWAARFLGDQMSKGLKEHGELSDLAAKVGSVKNLDIEKIKPTLSLSSGEDLPSWVKPTEPEVKAAAPEPTPDFSQPYKTRLQAQEAGLRALGDRDKFYVKSNVTAGGKETHFVIPKELAKTPEASAAAGAKEPLTTPRPGEATGESTQPAKEVSLHDLLADEEGQLHVNANPMRALSQVIERALPDKPLERQAAENIIRNADSELALRRLQIEAALKESIEAHDNDGKTEFLAFMDAGEGKPGAQFMSPKDQAMAQKIHGMFEDRWDKVKKIKDIEPGAGIENYLAHVWEKPGLVKNTISRLIYGKKPLEGRASFLRERTYDYASQGVAAGLTPATWNPIRMQMAQLFQLDKFILAHEIKTRFKDTGLVNWYSFDNLKNKPYDWQPLNDKIFQPSIMEGGGLKSYGKYYGPPEVAKVFNRYLEPGLHGNPTYDAIRQYGNILNQVNLGVSMYHGTFETIVSGISDAALGIEKVVNNHDIGGFKNLARGTLGTFLARSAVSDYNLGKKIQAEAISPGANPGLKGYVDAITRGGGVFAQDPEYTMPEMRGMIQAIKQGKISEALGKPLQSLAKPIMKYYVPRLKLGMAAKLMQSKLDYFQKNGITDQFQIDTELGKVWDSIDNRAGQLKYNNLFWNKIAQDVAFIGVRAVGWDLGIAREGFGAIRDTAKQSAKALRGERPLVTSRMAFAIATPVVVGMLGGVMHYLITGQTPQKTENYFYPGNDDTGRTSLPSYMKDFYSFKHAPAQTLVNKLHPAVEQANELYHNANFYDQEIRHPGDPMIKQGLDVVKWWAGTYVPISIKGAERQYQTEGAAGAGASIFGFMPAPAWVGQSKAQELAFELAQRNWMRGPRTPQDVDRYALMKQLERKLERKTLPTSEVMGLYKQGKLRDQDVDQLYDGQGDSSLVRDAKRINLPDLMAVMRRADPSEKQELKEVLYNKLDNIDSFTSDQAEQKRLFSEAKEFLK